MTHAVNESAPRSTPPGTLSDETFVEPAICARLGDVQLALVRERAHGWLIYDVRGRSPVAARLLSPSGGPRRAPEHRFFYWIPAEGMPLSVVHEDDAASLPDLPGDRTSYRRAVELRNLLETLIPREGVVLVEQAPFAQIPDLAIVDEGTMSLLRAGDTQLRSSIELANRFAGPLRPDERAALDTILSDFEAVSAMLVRSTSTQPPTSWASLWNRVVDHASARGLAVHPESGLALGAERAYQRACSRTGPRFTAGDRARLDLWVKRADGAHDLVVPESLEVVVGEPSDRDLAATTLAATCEAHLVEALDARARAGRVLGTEVAVIAYDVARRAGARCLTSCVGWPLGPIPRGSHAATLDAEAFADPRELVVGGVWVLRWAVELDGSLAWRTSLFERTPEGIRVLRRGADVPFRVPAP